MRGDDQRLVCSRRARSASGDPRFSMASGHHITRMKNSFSRRTFGVGVLILDTCATTVSSFATEAVAEAWIARDTSNAALQSRADAAAYSCLIGLSAPLQRRRSEAAIRQ